MPLIPLNTVNADASQRETKKSKLIDIIIENTNLGIDENLYEPSRGIAIVDSFEQFGRYTINLYVWRVYFVEYLLNEFGRAELIPGSYRKLFSKPEE